MSDADDTTIITGHDARVVWRTVTIAITVVAVSISSIIYIVSEWVKLNGRVEQLEKAQANREREAQRELWRRDREQRNPGSPSSTPPGRAF